MFRYFEDMLALAPSGGKSGSYTNTISGKDEELADQKEYFLRIVEVNTRKVRPTSTEEIPRDIVSVIVASPEFAKYAQNVDSASRKLTVYRGLYGTLKYKASGKASQPKRLSDFPVL